MNIILPNDENEIIMAIHQQKGLASVHIKKMRP